MTAVSGGGQPESEGRAPFSSVLERADAAPLGVPPATSRLDRIFPHDSRSMRNVEMERTWSAFNADMLDPVKAAISREGSSSEIAYAAGEIVHNYFRARGTTLTSYELRELVSELLDRYGVIKPDVLNDSASAEKLSRPRASSPPDDVVSFEKQTPAMPWHAEEAAGPAPAVAEQVFEPPASELVELLERDEASFDRWLLAVVECAGPGIAAVGGERLAAKAIVAAAVDKVLGRDDVPSALRARLHSAAISEVCGLGLLDRIWDDRSIHAVLVNGPAAVFVERSGVLHRTKEVFRDQKHLTELLGRLVQPSPRGVCEFQLRDGTSGVVVFPPAAPGGPVLAMRRPEPASATFERLIAAGMMNRSMADLLRIAARCRLNVLISGPSGSGKTSLLAALAHDMEESRVVTVARHRVFRSTAPTRIELVAQGEETPLPTLMAAVAGLRPDLFIVDSAEFEDIPAVVERLARGPRGIFVAIDPVSLVAGLSRSVDLVVRLARGEDGLYRAVSMEDAAGMMIFAYESGRFDCHAANPGFSALVRACGLGEAMAAILH